MSAKKIKVAVIFGGRSPEHEVSVVSASYILKALNTEKYDIYPVAITKEGDWYHLPHLTEPPKAFLNSHLPEGAQPVALIPKHSEAHLLYLKDHKTVSVDLAFPVLHGMLGEDGTIQGLFRILNLPFVGCDVLGSAACMDKDLMKKLFLHEGLPTAQYKTVYTSDRPNYESLVAELGTPLFIKPANAGSSVGVHKVRSAAELDAAYKDAFNYDTKLLVEAYVKGRELEVAVLGHRDHAKASLPGEVHVHADFYSYEAKYVDPNGASFSIPAKLEEKQLQEIQRLAIHCFQLMECDGLARIDFFLDESGRFYINEVNTLPGFTSISMFPKLWTLSEYSYTALLDQLIDLALEKQEIRTSLMTAYGDLGK